MKKVFATLLVFALLLTGCSNKPKDFRGVNWGASRADVKKSEDIEPLFESDDLILYQTVLDGIDAEIYYHFVDNKLTEAQIQYRINFTIEHVLMDFVNHYFETRDSFIELYGQPLNPEFRVWLIPEEEIPIYEPDPYNQLMYYQRVEFLQEWVTEDSYISLTLNYRDLQENYIYYTCDIAVYESGNAAVYG